VSTARKCTLGFAIRKIARGKLGIDHGFLTLGDCLYARASRTHSIFAYYASQNNPEELEAVRIGTTVNTNWKNEPNLGLSFALVKILPDTAQNTY